MVAGAPSALLLAPTAAPLASSAAGPTKGPTPLRGGCVHGHGPLEPAFEAGRVLTTFLLLLFNEKITLLGPYPMFCFTFRPLPCPAGHYYFCHAFFINKASTSRSRPRSFRPSHITLLRFIQLARRVESRYNNSVGNGFMCSFLRLVILMCHIVFLVHWVWVVRMLYQPSAKRKKAVLPCIVFRHS